MVSRKYETSSSLFRRFVAQYKKKYGTKYAPSFWGMSNFLDYGQKLEWQACSCPGKMSELEKQAKTFCVTELVHCSETLVVWSIERDWSMFRDIHEHWKGSCANKAKDNTCFQKHANRSLTLMAEASWQTTHDFLTSLYLKPAATARSVGPLHNNNIARKNSNDNPHVLSTRWWRSIAGSLWSSPLITSANTRPGSQSIKWKRLFHRWSRARQTGLHSLT